MGSSPSRAAGAGACTAGWALFLYLGNGVLTAAQPSFLGVSEESESQGAGLPIINRGTNRVLR